MKPHLFLVVTATFVLTAFATQTSALDFDFAKIVDTNTPIPEVGGTFDVLGVPALDGYQVAVRGHKFAPNYQVIYISAGGALSKVVATSDDIPGAPGNTFVGFGDPSISGGNVAFYGDGDGVRGIYTSIGGMPMAADDATAIPSGVGNFTGFSNSPSIGGAAVAFFGGGSSDQQGIYSTSGGLHVVADKNTPMPNGAGNFGYFFYTLSPSMDDGNVAFVGSGSGQQGIYTDFGGMLQVVADTTMPMPGGPGNFVVLGFPSISSGNFAFWGSDADGTFQGIYTDVGGLHRVADTSTRIPDGTRNFSQLMNPSLDDGNVVFSTGGAGVFTDYGGTLSAVATPSMQIDGKLVIGVNSGPKALSNSNVAFFVSFSDGTSGIFVAEQNYAYTANTSGAWDTAGNWSFGLKPRAVVPTVIRPEYGAVITGPAAPTTLRALNFGSLYSGVTELRLAPAGQLTVKEWLVVETFGRLNVNGSVATAVYGIDNYGEIDLAGGQINGGGMYNSGTLRGSGTIGNNLFNTNRIQAIDAHMQFNAAVFNFETARIDARNALLEFNGGLLNSGRMNFSFGTSDVFGDIENLPGETGPGGQIIVSGGAGVTFYGDINQQGSLTVSKVGSTTSVAVFFGLVEGNGATGGGDIFFEGGLEPGPEFTAGDVAFDNNVAFGSQAMLEIELGDDADYDHVDVTGLLTLDGTLDVELVPGFRPNLGDSFDILDWGTRSGEFDTLDLPGLLGNLKWDTSRLYSDGVLAVLAAGLPGDYNQNGIVDTADYVLWRKNPGNFPADAYATWRSHFGQTAGSGMGASANSAIPEPATLVLFLVGILASIRFRRKAAS